MTPSGPILLWSGSGETAIDIWFVHGLRGDAIATWSKGETCWPRDFLPRDIPDSRVYTWGYDSSVLNPTRAASQASIFGHAENLLGDIARTRSANEEENRFLILVGHSLGGLVIKEALIRSSEYFHNGQDETLGSVFDQTRGVVFIGTPHRGSSQASIGSVVARAARAAGFRPNDSIVSSLEQESHILEHQRKSFASISRDLHIACVFEEVPTKWGVVVPEYSACIDGFNVRTSSVPADHAGICKFGNQDEIGYQRIVGHILSFIREARRGATREFERDAQFSKNLLQNLAFNTMDERERTLEPAHAKTFLWLLDSHSPLVTWLKSEEPLFWISGKAGSGKSTLFRTLFWNGQVEKIIKTHFADETILLARYYFFDRGHDLLQKSQEGLMRAIFHQLISQCEGLGPLLFGPPKAQNSLWQPGSKWTWDGLETAFETLLRQLPDSIRFFLFIDGLDEYRSLDRFDSYDYYDDDDSVRARMIADGHERIAALLTRACQHARVKICVTSRPLLRFRDEFESYKHIKLHELTSNDISEYIRARFSSNQRLDRLTALEPKLSGELAEDIGKRACGVFLWVRLVVDILFRGLTDRDGIDELRSKVRAIPPELGGRNGLYMKMLKDIPVGYRLQGYKIFQIVLAIDNDKKLVQDIDLLTLGLSESRIESIIENPFKYKDLRTSTAGCDTLQEIMEGRFQSRCAGLLEPQQFNPGRELGQMWWLCRRPLSTVRFLHQTAKDFIAETANWELLLPTAGRMVCDPYTALLGGYILLLPSLSTGFEQWILLRRMLRYAYSSEVATGMSPVALLDCMDSIMGEISMKKTAHWAGCEANPVAGGEPIYCWGRDMLVLAAQANLSLYLKSKIGTPGMSAVTKMHGRILGYALAPQRVSNSMKTINGSIGVKQADPSVTQTLLELGYNPNEAIGGRLYDLGANSVWRAVLAYGLFMVTTQDMRTEYFEKRNWLENARLLIRGGARVCISAGDQVATRHTALYIVTLIIMKTEASSDDITGTIQDMVQKGAHLAPGERKLLFRSISHTGIPASALRVVTELPEYGSPLDRSAYTSAAMMRRLSVTKPGGDRKVCYYVR